MITFLRNIIIEKGWALVWMPIVHFILSAIVGLLAYWLTLIILSHGQFGLYVTEKLSYHLGFSIHHFSLSVALCSAVAVHILEDYTLNIF